MYAFQNCYNLLFVKFGTNFKTKTTIRFEVETFIISQTKNIDLILGKYVLPTPKLETKSWNDYSDDMNPFVPFIWKNISIYDND
jgi:hypothetical protein